MKKILLLWCLLLLYSAQTGAAENLVLTTYYPAPYGAYVTLLAKKIAVGDTDGNGSLSDGDQPSADGQLYVARSVVFKPQAKFPKEDLKAGEMIYYDNGKKDGTAGFYYYDGTYWVGQFSGGQAVYRVKSD